MIKKVIFWSLVIGGVVIAVNSFRPGAISTALKRAHAKFEKKIPPEFELARIRDQITQLRPDMDRNISKIAEEMVAVQSLEIRTGDLQTRLDGAKNELALLTEAVEKGTTTRVSINGREFSVTQVKDKLRTCKNLEGELNRTQRILDAKRQGVNAAREKLAEMKRQQEELLVMAAEYEAKLQELALQEVRKDLQIDDSRLAEIKASFEELQKRIDVARTEVELRKDFNAGTITEKKPVSSTNVVEEAREYLGNVKTEATKK